MVAKKKKPTKKDYASTEFLIQTLASIQFALSSIAKESSAKTDALDAVLENIKSMADMMKHFHDVNAAATSKIVELESVIRNLETRLLAADTDLKEIKYAVQKVNENLFELKTVQQTKEEIKAADKAEPKKFNFITFVRKIVEALSNVKTILIIVLVIVLLVASLLYGPGVVQTFIDVFKETHKIMN